MRELMNFEDWSLAWLRGTAASFAAGKSTVAQFNGVKRRLQSWGISNEKIDAVIATETAKHQPRKS